MNQSVKFETGVGTEFVLFWNWLRRPLMLSCCTLPSDNATLPTLLCVSVVQAMVLTRKVPTLSVYQLMALYARRLAVGHGPGGVAVPGPMFISPIRVN